MGSVARYRARRFIASSSRVLLIGVPALIAFAAASLTKGSPEIPWWLIGGGIGGAILLAYQAKSEYQHRTYDPTWAFKFDDRLYDSEIKEARSKAARILKDNQGKLRSTDRGLKDIDDVLDFLEDIGFYVRGDQISPEVAHHHFYHWIRGYYLAARDYIEAWQEQESASWKHVKELFETTREIEARDKGSTTLTADQISDFLESEINLVQPNNHSPGDEH
jgi:hypothetical protein